MIPPQYRNRIERYVQEHASQSVMEQHPENDYPVVPLFTSQTGVEEDELYAVQ